MLESWLKPWATTSGDIFVDVGANVGTWTKWLAAGFRQIHAIEPNPEALIGLRMGLPTNVFVHDVGAWDSDGPVCFTQFTESVHLTAYFRNEGINTGARRGDIILECRTIDSLGIRPKVDFLKCDTEGAEVRSLQGAELLIARDRPRLLVECHSVDNFTSLQRLLADWRYQTTVVRHPHYKVGSEFWHAHCWFVCSPAN